MIIIIIIMIIIKIIMIIIIIIMIIIKIIMIIIIIIKFIITIIIIIGIQHTIETSAAFHRQMAQNEDRRQKIVPITPPASSENNCCIYNYHVERLMQPNNT